MAEGKKPDGCQLGCAGMILLVMLSSMCGGGGGGGYDPYESALEKIDNGQAGSMTPLERRTIDVHMNYCSKCGRSLSSCGH